MEELSPVNSNWEQLGWELGVSGVEASSPGDGLCKVLRKWLKYHIAYWGDVFKALINVGEERLASELKVKYGELATIESLRVCIDDGLVSIWWILMDLYYYNVTALTAVGDFLYLLENYS